MTHKPLERDEVQLNIEAADWEDAIRKVSPSPGWQT